MQGCVAPGSVPVKKMPAATAAKPLSLAAPAAAVSKVGFAGCSNSHREKNSDVRLVGVFRWVQQFAPRKEF
jgi:hypothetical protein